ncbi:unnamed protein product [Toxocara canis]|uniref:Secreted protein n=1 Tax=Toxocara canis TaxID=6265 RepID=A0A183V5S6_TOXCA|nr:unnamed protein product [Toxocara canis]
MDAVLLLSQTVGQIRVVCSSDLAKVPYLLPLSSSSGLGQLCCSLVRPLECHPPLVNAGVLNRAVIHRSSVCITVRFGPPTSTTALRSFVGHFLTHLFARCNYSRNSKDVGLDVIISVQVLDA